MEGKTLHLMLKKKWFDMILSGEKKEEYREIKPYWVSRLTLLPKNYITPFTYDNAVVYFAIDDDCMNYSFDTITFKNGYSKNAPEMEIELNSIEVKFGNINWGAEPGQKYFVLSLGEIISTKNIQYAN